MGVAVRLVSILAATKSWLDPEHLPLGQAAFLGGAGPRVGVHRRGAGRALFNAVIGGTPALFTGFMAGAIFAVSAWIVDLAHHSPYSSVS